MPLDFPQLRHPIVQAPMAGGPSTPALAAAVSVAGGLGFLAAGYKSPDDFRGDIAGVRRLTSAPFGVNLFCLTRPAAVDDEAISRYASLIEPEAQRHGVALGRPRFDDDSFAAKLEITLTERPHIVSFTFGCPEGDVVAGLHERQIPVWVTVTELDEARQAEEVGADALIVQGVEAGGHRGSFEDRNGRGEMSLLPLLRLVASATDVPLVASGGICDGAGVAAALAAGARAVQIGTGFMRCPEAGTSPVHRDALVQPAGTAVTRAFSGRRARGIVNAFMRDYEAAAPSAYPHIHYLTAPLRAAARKSSDGEAINLWAGEAHALAEDLPAAEIVNRLAADARAALVAADQRLDPGA
jgi:nitronate monooxygenase